MTPQEKIATTLYEMAHTAKTMFKVEVSNFTFTYDLSYHRALGSVRTKNGKTTMRLNKPLLDENPDLYIKEVVMHEYAHLIVSARFPTGYNGSKRVQPHGREFKAVCRAFGIEGKSTTKAFMNSPVLASLSKPRLTRNKKVHYYKCNCGIPLELSSIRHNRVQRGEQQYKCNRCDTRLSYIKSA